MIEDKFKLQEYRVQLGHAKKMASIENNVIFISVYYNEKKGFFEKHIFDNLQDIFNFNINLNKLPGYSMNFAHIDGREGVFYFYRFYFYERFKRVTEIRGDLKIKNWIISIPSEQVNNNLDCNLLHLKDNRKIENVMQKYFEGCDFYLSLYSLLSQFIFSDEKEECETTLQYISDDIRLFEDAKVFHHKDVNIVIDSNLRNTSIDKINKLIGLARVKDKINELIKFQVVNQLKRRKTSDQQCT
jgi:hypothetical protein